MWGSPDRFLRYGARIKSPFRPHFLVFYQLKMTSWHVAIFAASNYDDETMEVNFVIYFIQVLYFWNSGGTYFLTSSQVWRNLTAIFCYKIHQRHVKMNKWNIVSKEKNNQDTAGNSSPFLFAYSVYTPVFISSVGLRLHTNYKKKRIIKQNH